VHHERVEFRPLTVEAFDDEIALCLRVRVDVGDIAVTIEPLDEVRVVELL
jgi:hypothetical protein